MADILSKEEIETLLSAVSKGKIPQKEKKAPPAYKKAASLYNFKRPALVSRDQIRVLEFLHEEFIRSCGVKLSNYLRTTVEVEIVAVEQLTYTEFIASLSEPTYIVTIDAKPLSGQIILEINPFLCFSIVDRLLGGSGKNSQEVRELTRIEQSIMEKVTGLILRALEEAWQHVISFKLEVKSRNSNPEFVQIVSGGELVILLIFKVNMGENYGIFNICYPFSTLRPLLPQLSPQRWLSHQRWLSQKKGTTEERDFKLLQRKITGTNVEVVVDLGQAEITILDFLRLAPGDVIILNKSVNEDLLVKVQGFPKFYASPGRVGKRKAVKITSWFKKEEDDGE